MILTGVSLGIILLGAPRAPAVVNILTNHNDMANTGENLQEHVLTPHNVRVGLFGKLFVTRLNGVDYGQPLFVSHVNITTGPHPGVQNIIIATTSRDAVYAINSDTGSMVR